MNGTNRSSCKKIFLILAMLTITMIIFESRNYVKDLVNNNRYPHPKSDTLSFNLTILPQKTNFSDPKEKIIIQIVPITDTITNNLITFSTDSELSVPTGKQSLPQAYLKSTIATYNLTTSPEYVEFSNPIKKRRLPQAILIGAMKCGTRALTTMMEMHTKFVAPVREIHFFDRKYDLGLKWYQSQMPFTYEDQITFEKSPSYFKMIIPEIPSRIHSMNSSIRLILIVRDPVIRSISHFVHNLPRMKRHEKLNFEDVVLSSGGKVNRTHPYIIHSLYEQAFKMYLEVFLLKQILVIDGDQLIKNPLPIIEKVERFLNLEPEITKANFYFDKDKGFYCMKNNGNEGCLSRKKGHEHPKVDKDSLRKLRKFFAPYNQRFYDLVGHDFGW